jgi:hypothetical protein
VGKQPVEVGAIELVNAQDVSWEADCRHPPSHPFNETLAAIMPPGSVQPSAISSQPIAIGNGYRLTATSACWGGC